MQQHAAGNLTRINSPCRPAAHSVGAPDRKGCDEDRICSTEVSASSTTVLSELTGPRLHRLEDLSPNQFGHHPCTHVLTFATTMSLCRVWNATPAGY